MTIHLETGKSGEAIAAGWLHENGYKLIAQNWRTGHYEVDIIAEKNTILHFVEVKTLTSSRFGYPEAKAGKAKIRNMIRAAEVYVQQHPHWKKIRFDILSITLGNGDAQCYWIEDVFA